MFSVYLIFKGTVARYYDRPGFSTINQAPSGPLIPILTYFSIVRISQEYSKSKVAKGNYKTSKHVRAKPSDPPAGPSKVKPSC
jgi:hypothetical protein